MTCHLVPKDSERDPTVFRVPESKYSCEISSLRHNWKLCLSVMGPSQLINISKDGMFRRISPPNRRRAAARAPPTSDPPLPDSRWSSWWWFSVPFRRTHSDTPSSCRRWWRRSAAPRKPGQAGCAVPRSLSPPPALRSGLPPSAPRRSDPVRATAARPTGSWRPGWSPTATP